MASLRRMIKQLPALATASLVSLHGGPVMGWGFWGVLDMTQIPEALQPQDYGFWTPSAAELASSLAHEASVGELVPQLGVGCRQPIFRWDS